MNYQPTIIFPTNSQPTISKTDKDVDLYVVRTDVFGSKLLGDRGLYHSGLMFRSKSTSWVIDLSIKGSMVSIIPYITKDGEVAVDNPIIIEYYSPETEQLWQSYWTNKGSKICTLSPQLYNKLLDYMLKELAPAYDKYIPFSISNKPFYSISGKQDTIVSEIYASDNTCDKLPMRCFEWLQDNHGIDCKPFPVTRMVLSVDQKPIPIKNLKDPGLIDYTDKIQKYVQIFSKIHRKDPSSMVDLYDLLSKQQNLNILEYILALDNATHKPQWYKLPTRDVSISAEDMYFQLPKRDNNLTVIIVVVLGLLTLAILLFLLHRKKIIYQNIFSNKEWSL